MTVNGTSLSGTVDGAALNGTGVATQHGSFTGTVSGSNLTLTFSGAFGSTSTVSGGVSNDTIVLNLPGSNGTIQAFNLVPSDTATYNPAVIQLQQQASGAQATQAAIAQQAQLDNAVSAAAQSVTADLGRVDNDRSVSLPSLSDDLQKQQVSLATMRSDEAKTRTDPDPSNRCYDAGNVVYDAGNVQYDLGNIQYDQNSIGSAATSAQADVNTLSGDFAKLQAALQADPRYGSATPSEQQVSSETSALQSMMNAEITAAAAALSKAKGISDATNAEAAAFQKQYC